MEAETRFVVVRSGGEFEDAWQHNILVTPTKATAEAYIEERKAKDEAFNAIYRQLWDFSQKWFEANPIPPGEPLEQWPRWGSGIKQSQITQAMRDERATIKARNDVVSARNSARTDQWQDRRLKARQEFLVSIGQTAESLEKYEHRYEEINVSYTIEEVKYLP